MIEIAPNADTAGSSLWFEVPRHLQPYMAKFVRSKINQLKDKDAKDAMRDRVKETTMRSVKYSRSIPLLGGITVYTLYGEWRFGAKGSPSMGAQDRIEAEIQAFADKQSA